MAQDRPVLFPRWTTDPPAGPPTDITEPTSAQKDSGWQPSGSAEFPDGKPVRQLMNWLQNLAHQWVKWLDQSARRSSDLHQDQVLPNPAPNVPTIAAGLGPVAANDFSASVYTDGYRVPDTPSPIHTYNATSDTYWDLTKDCVWHFTVVASGAGAPAVFANSVRVFAVRTDGADRTLLLLDNLTARTHIWFLENMRSLGDLMVAGQLEIGAQTDDEPAGGSVPPDFDAFTPRIIGTGRGFGGEVRWQVWEFGNESAGIQIIRAYVGVGENRNQFELVWGARCTGNFGNNWITDSNASDAFRIVLGGDDLTNLNFLRAEKIIGIGTSTTFSDADWSDADVAGQSAQLEVPGGLKLGQDLNDGAAATVGLVPHLDHVSKPGGASGQYTLIRQDLTAGSGGATTTGLREYHASRAFSLDGPGVVRTFNARWDEATGLWVRDDNALRCFLEVTYRNGIFKAVHEIAEPNTWADTLGTSEIPGTWSMIESLGILSSQLRANDPGAAFQGSGFAAGRQWGYGDGARGCRKIFGVELAIIGQNDFAVSEDQFGHVFAGVDPARFPRAAITADKDLFIPIMLPHEAVVTGAAVLHTSLAANNLQAEFIRDDTFNATTSYRESLHTGGPDAVWTNTGGGVRLFESLSGLDQNLTINNQRHRYGMSILLDQSAGPNVVIYAVRVDFDVKYLSGSM